MVFVLLFTSCDVFFDGVVPLSLISYGALKASCIRHHHNWISLAYLLAGIFLKTQLLWITPGLVGHAALLRRQGSSAEQDPWLADRTSLPRCFVGYWYPDHQVTDHICFLLASASSFHLPRQTIEVQKVVFEELLLVVQADKTLPFEDVAKNISDLLPKFLTLYIFQMSSIVSVLIDCCYPIASSVGTSSDIDLLIVSWIEPHLGFLISRTPPNHPWAHNRFNKR